MPAQEKKHWDEKRLLTVTVLALLTLLSLVNLKIVQEPLGRFIQRELSFEDFVNEVQNGYLSDNFTGKHDFLNLNGLFARLTGRGVLNGVVKLNNGMLSIQVGVQDATDFANGIANFSDYLSEYEGVPFLYVQLPFKESLDGQEYPVGMPSYANENADDLLFRLSEREVKTLDLRPMLSQTPEMLEQYFYKTDHHWNSDGAFVAFQEILKYLYELFPEGNIDLTYAQPDQWERHSTNNWFLGSWGKRVGTFFGGTDPLIWYTPKFETEMSCAVPIYEWLFRGDFTEANIRTQYIEEKDYFGASAYCVYTGGDYPLVQHRNLNAPSSMKIMMIKDSFMLPLQAFLSTVFQEIDVIDPRHFSECAVAEYADRIEPDIVILAINADVSGGVYQDFGEETAISIKTEESSYELAARQDIEIAAKDHDYNYVSYPLDANTVYRVSFEGADILEGQTEGVGLQLYNNTSAKILDSAIFDLAYCRATNGFTWTFRTPDTQDELQLAFYAGIYGSTGGNSVIYRDVTLEKCTVMIHDD